MELIVCSPLSFLVPYFEHFRLVLQYVGPICRVRLQSCKPFPRPSAGQPVGPVRVDRAGSTGLPA
jgi:hypothetical protein